MRAFVGGVIAGAMAVALIWWIVSTALHPAEPPSVAPMAPRDPSTPALPAPPVQPRTTSRVRAAPVSAEAEAEPESGFPPGEAVLHPGEGYVFGEPHARRRSESEGADVVCLDIDGGLQLACRFGARAADVPLGAVGVPETPRAAAALVSDAPQGLAPGNVGLGLSSSAANVNVALVRSASGRTFKVFTLEVGSQANVLDRTARIGYAEVPEREGGGVLAVPATTSAAGAPTLADLAAIEAAGDAIPNASFANFIKGDYVRLASPPAELVLDERKYLLVDEPLTTTIEFKRYSGLVAARGIAPSGRVRIGSYTGVAVRGDMAGEIDVNSYAYVHVSGNLTGKLLIRSYATVVIDGDLLGEVEASSYVTLLLRGRLGGKLSIRTSNSKFWFQQFMPRSVFEPLAAGSSSNELHLRESDLSAGEYKDEAGWQKIVVGEEAWKLVAK